MLPLEFGLLGVVGVKPAVSLNAIRFERNCARMTLHGLAACPHDIGGGGGGPILTAFRPASLPRRFFSLAFAESFPAMGTRQLFDAQDRLFDCCLFLA